MQKGTRDRVAKVVLHILIWAVFLVLSVYSARRFRTGSNFLFVYYTLTTISAIIFYTNYLVLVPGLFFKKKRYLYFIAVISLVFCFYFISDFSNKHVISYISKRGNPEQLINESNDQLKRQPGRPPIGRRLRPGFILAIPNAHLIGYTTSSLFMVFLSLGIRVLERQSKIEKMQEEMERSKLNAELAFLKNQISPHFFFNTLNNIYSLIDRSKEDSKNAVIKLSKLMRYVLNESGKDYRLLSDEIEFMNNYVDLMKLRTGSRTRFNINFPAKYTDYKVPHLLFVSLIENAIKYGISVQEESFVDISLECGENNLVFKSENGLPDRNSDPFVESHGIGLDNLRKRLNLLYPGRHELEINKTKSTFKVTLNIRLK